MQKFKLIIKRCYVKIQNQTVITTKLFKENFDFKNFKNKKNATNEKLQISEYLKFFDKL